MIVDGHCHAGRGDRLTAPWNTHAPLETYLRRARAAGIQRTVILPAGHSDYAQANREIGQIVNRHPGRFIGFASVHAVRDAGRVDELVREAVTRLGLRGLKVHCYDAPPNREVCDAVRKFGIPMLVDVVGRAYLVELFAQQYPDVNFIIPHFGSFVDDWRAQQQVVDQLVRFPNVYADTAGVRRFDFIVQAIRRAGACKVLFGSDGPWLHPSVELHKIRMLGLSSRDEALVLGGNVLRLVSRQRRSQPASLHRNSAPQLSTARDGASPKRRQRYRQQVAPG
jgi:predicted TIM-barrel fold metal-dependent hydrolase